MVEVTFGQSAAYKWEVNTTSLKPAQGQSIDWLSDEIRIQYEDLRLKLEENSGRSSTCRHARQINAVWLFCTCSDAWKGQSACLRSKQRLLLVLVFAKWSLNGDFHHGRTENHQCKTSGFTSVIKMPNCLLLYIVSQIFISSLVLVPSSLLNSTGLVHLQHLWDTDRAKWVQGLGSSFRVEITAYILPLKSKSSKWPIGFTLCQSVCNICYKYFGQQLVCSEVSNKQSFGERSNNS